MHAPLPIQATVATAQVKIQDDRLILQAQLALELPLPEQDAELPGRLEAGIERGGQILKRRLFQQAVEQADAELILASTATGIDVATRLPTAVSPPCSGPSPCGVTSTLQCT